MSERAEAEEFDEADEELDEAVGDDEVDVDRVMKDMEIAKRRAAKGGEPAWRRLERRMEQKHTAELISDFEDYDIGDGQGEARSDGGRQRSAGRSKLSRAGH